MRKEEKQRIFLIKLSAFFPFVDVYFIFNLLCSVLIYHSLGDIMNTFFNYDFERQKNFQNHGGM